MRKNIVSLIIIAALVVSCSDKSTNPDISDTGEFLYVVNGLEETVSCIDLKEETVTNGLYLTGQIPAEIQYRAGELFIVNSGDNSLSIVDLETDNTRTIEIGDYRNPSHIEFIGADRAAVCNWVSGTVSFLDLSGDSVLSEISVGAGLWGMTEYEGRLYVGISNYDPATWSYGQGRVAVIDASTMTLLDSVEVGTNPGILFLDHQGELNVVCTGDYFSVFGEVCRVDPVTLEVMDSYEIGGSPGYEGLASDGMVYLGAGGWVDEAYVLKYDSEAESVLNGASNPIALSGEAGAQGVAFDSEGSIYVCCFNTDHIVKMDASGNVLETYEVGDGPQSIVYVER